MRYAMLLLFMAACQSEDHKAAVQICEQNWSTTRAMPEYFKNVTEKFWMQECVAKVEPTIPQCRGIATSVPEFCHNAMDQVAFEIHEEAEAQAAERR